VQARQLRLRLDEYYRTAGVNEPLLLKIPKGTYVPSFHPREAPRTAASQPEVVPNVINRWRLTALLAAGFACITSGLAAYLWFQRHSSPSQPATSSRAVQLKWPLSRIFSPERETYVVVADTMYMLTSAISGVQIPLEEYLAPSYPAKFLDASIPGAIRNNLLMLSKRNFLSDSDLIGVSWLSRLSEANGLRINVRHARQLGVQELSDHHMIFFGSPVSNPWTSLYVQDLNFQVGADKNKGIRFFTNKNPAPGEPRTFASSWTGVSSTDYGIVALLPNLGGQGNVLILYGSMTEGTQAAALFLSDPANCARLHTALGKPAGPTYFEALIRVTAIDGSVRQPEIAAIRPWKPAVK
jgi:hypothetical protein